MKDFNHNADRSTINFSKTVKKLGYEGITRFYFEKRDKNERMFKGKSEIPLTSSFLKVIFAEFTLVGSSSMM